MNKILIATGNPVGLLRKTVVVASTVVVAGVALMFSAVLLSAMLVIGVTAFAYLWWKTRVLRKQMRKQMADFAAHNEGMQRETFTGEVIDGEVIHVHESGKKR